MSNRWIMQTPNAREALLRGMDQMTALMRPTLGPVGRPVAIAGATGTSVPEVLDSAATIARRTIQIADPFEDMGAMIIRQLAWTVFDGVGDGAATAAVLCQEMVRASNHLIAAGSDPMSIKRGIERGLRIATENLRLQSRHLEQPGQIARVVRGTLREPGLAEMVGEIVETVGSDGAVLFEDARSVKTSYEYVEGTCWDGGYLSYFLLPEGENEARLFMPRILLTDQDLTAEQLLPVVEICIAAGERNLLVIAPHLSDSAVALLVLNRDRGVLDTAMAVRSPQTGPQRDEILLDLAAITGGRYIRTGAGDRFTDVTLQDLGAARHAWVTEHAFGILGGGGSRGEIRQRVTEAKAQLRETKNDDRTCKTIQERIGKLTGAVAIIRVGAPTQSVQVELRSRIEAAVRSARSAFCHGGVPGGGAAYLSCIPVLERLRDELDGDEELGVAVLAKALAAPLRAIAVNAGAEPGLIADEGCRRGPWETFDATEKEWVDAWATGIVDPLPVALTALQASVSAATMALTIEVLVRHKNPKYALEP